MVRAMADIERLIKSVKELKFTIPTPKESSGTRTSILTPRPLSELK